MRKTGWALVIIVGVWGYSTAQSAGLTAEQEQTIIRNVLSIYQPQSVTLSAGEHLEFHKCGTAIMAEVRWLWPQLSEQTRALLRQYVEERPALSLFYDTPDGHFRIHYDTSGTDSVDMSYGVDGNGIPKYVDTCAEILHTVWQKEINDLEYPAPPADDFYEKGGTAALDIYLINMGNSFLGLTQGEEIVPGTEHTIPKTTSFIELDNDYHDYGGYSRDQWKDMMSVTVAHEFFHTVQYGIDATELWESDKDYQNGHIDIWWHEMSAVWMEDAVFSNVNDYLAYLPAFFNHPNWALTTQGSFGDKGLFPYGAVVWPRFLSEQFGDGIIHDIWMQCGQKAYLNSIEGFRDQIAARGSSFPIELGRFRLWCYFSGSRWRQFSFSEGAHYPTIPDTAFLTVHTSYPVLDSISPLKRPEYLGTAYLEFVRPATDSAFDFKTQILNDKLDMWAVSAAGIAGNATPEIYSIRDISQPLVVPNWQNYDYVMVMVMPFSEDYSAFKDIPGQKFTYVESDSLEPVEGNKILPVRPNPYTIGVGSLYIPVQRATREKTEVFFYTVNGEFVRGGRQERTGGQTPFYLADGEGNVGATFTWDGRNAAGQEVASGIYLCLVRLGDLNSIQKIAVFHK